MKSITTEMLITFNETLAIWSENPLESEIEDEFTSYKEAYLAIRKLKCFVLHHSNLVRVKMLTDLQMHLQDIKIKGKIPVECIFQTFFSFVHKNINEISFSCFFFIFLFFFFLI